MFSTPSFSCLQCLGRDVRHLLCANCLAGVVERDQLDFGSPSPGILASAFPQLSQSCPRERESKKWTPRLQPAFSLSHLGERRNSFLKSLEWDLSLLQFNTKKKKKEAATSSLCCSFKAAHFDWENFATQLQEMAQHVALESRAASRSLCAL